MRVKEVSTIVVRPQRCTGCFTCQLHCSFAKKKVFNPAEARIMVDWVDDEPRISFTDDCDECGICVRSCPYGALTFLRAWGNYPPTRR